MKYVPSIVTVIGVCAATAVAAYATHDFLTLFGLLGLYAAVEMMPDIYENDKKEDP